MTSLGLAKELVLRTVVITAIYAIISYFLILNKIAKDPGQMAIAIPFLFVIFGIVQLVNILFSLKKYKAMDAK